MDAGYEMLNSYFNTSNVTIQHRCVYGIKAARQISIHLMLLFNFNPNKPCQQWSNFNTSNVTIQLAPILKAVGCSSNFNTSNVTIQLSHKFIYIYTSLHFNTSNVTIQLFKTTNTIICCQISIHLMLLFNLLTLSTIFFTFCISIHLMLLFNH